MSAYGSRFPMYVGRPAMFDNGVTMGLSHRLKKRENALFIFHNFFLLLRFFSHSRPGAKEDMEIRGKKNQQPEGAVSNRKLISNSFSWETIVSPQF